MALQKQKTEIITIMTVSPFGKQVRDFVSSADAVSPAPSHPHRSCFPFSIRTVVFKSIELNDFHSSPSSENS